MPGERAGIFICTRGRRKFAPLCSVCRKKRASIMCDGPKASGNGTCDAPLCTGCAKRVGPDRDLCPRHAEQLELGGARVD